MLSPSLRLPFAALLCVMAAAFFFEPLSPPAGARPLSEIELGKLAFEDPILSASGVQSCASCHAPSHGHAAPNALPVQPGGAAMDRQGMRTSQPLRYLAFNGRFHFDTDGTPTGGFFWDGRADSLAAQAEGPLLGEREMANPDKAGVVARIAQARWAADFRRLYGADILKDPERAVAALTRALGRFQAEDLAFNGFSSKYDAVLRGQAQLDAPEARGLALFNDAAKGNCAECHPSQRRDDGGHPLFTDFTYDTLGVPRNPAIAANADPAYIDLGLCDRPDLKTRTDLCGAFKVPSLRNVALRQAYFHNGHFTSLEDVVRFYVQRDTHPHKWYPPGADGKPKTFDDLPARFHDNVNREAPYDRTPGQAPALDEREIQDVVAFLKTLTDGWSAR
jgi:cytochrome c peroxidase